jgi:hypothetical protein
MLALADAPSADPDSADVVVTVTTRRYDQPGGTVISERQGIATGYFDTAILDALAQRLHPWALDQVLGRVLARRPAAGDPIDYLGSFSPVRELLIAVRPAADDGTPRCKTRPLRDLFLDYAAQPDQHAVVA